MKKIVMGIIALLAISTATVQAENGKKNAKSKKACTQKCPEKKNCSKTAQCPPVQCCSKA